MIFEGVGYSDQGATRESNQDSYLIKVAETHVGDVAMAAVADGMGGLEKGELASAAVARMLSEWFDTKLPLALEALDASVEGFELYVDGQLKGLVQEMNLQLIRYGMSAQANMGTTLTVMLAIGGRYSIAHVGDTRAYQITSDGIVQLTCDQTLVQRELEAGNITEEETRVHPQRNVLLQCLGSTREVLPQLIHGNVQNNAIYLLCSDGFRHEVTAGELYGALGPRVLDAAAWERERRWRESRAGAGMIPGGSGPEGTAPESPAPEGTPSSALMRIADLVMARGEADNITGIVLRAHAEEVRS
ncbi:PP2C family protein-serine/threonine phosphatase [Enorma phocaeensis]|uniref:PP2C family protein-serine/threonine phosphatase n=1 Tax=Enorma phocaeensis TaxID=1871019 RepID=UPI0015E10B38|nr:protein phosphatase 2C domain-containing protein [Enorma phocaeensis]